jgi:hypothetical protein
MKIPSANRNLNLFLYLLSTRAWVAALATTAGLLLVDDILRSILKPWLPARFICISLLFFILWTLLRCYNIQHNECAEGLNVLAHHIGNSAQILVNRNLIPPDVREEVMEKITNNMVWVCREVLPTLSPILQPPKRTKFTSTYSSIRAKNKL